MLSRTASSEKEKGAPGEKALKRVSGWTLALRKFRQHKLAVVSLWLLVAMYTVFVFAEFFAPYHQTESTDRVFMPPQALHFLDSEGQFHLRPFVYGKTFDFAAQLQLMRVSLSLIHISEPTRPY